MGSRLTKEEIQAALNERHSPEVQDMLSRGKVAIAGLGGLGSNGSICVDTDRSRTFAPGGF